MQFKAGTQVWTWDRCYGRDGDPTPTELNENVLAHLVHNVELQLSALPKRRAGSVGFIFAGATFNGFVKLGRFFGQFETPGSVDEYLFWTDHSGRQLWARFIGVPSVVQPIPTPDDHFSIAGTDSSFCQFNGKMYKAAISDVDRLHVMDPAYGSNAIRRVGLAAPGAPGVTDQLPPGTASGLRYYRIQFKMKDTLATRTRLASNLGTPVGWTPNGTGSIVRVAAPGLLGDVHVTHWVVYGSPDNMLYYNISGDIPITTPTFDDTIPVGNYANYEAAPEEGTFNSWPSVKYLLSGVDRLIGFGAFGGQPTPFVGNVSTLGRVWFSPVLGTTNTEDDERVPVQPAGSNPIQNWLDVGRGIGAEDRGLGGPIDGNVLVFQSRGVYLMVPTGNVYAPFKRVTISTDVGAVECSIFSAQDELGRPCVMWFDENSGPWRYGAAGLQWMGFDVRDEVAKYNRTAPEFTRVHGVFHNDTHTAYFWICQTDTVGTGRATRILKFNSQLGKDTGPTGVRFGWTTEDGDWSTAYGSVVMRRSALGVGAAAAATFQPMASGVNGTKLLMRDVTQVTDDGTTYGAYARSKVIALSGAAFQLHQLVTDWLYLQAMRAATPMQITIWRNYIDQIANAFTTTRRLDPPLQSAESRVLLRYEGLLVQDAYAIQIEIGDQTAVAATANWDVDYVSLPIEVRTQERSNVS